MKLAELVQKIADAEEHDQLTATAALKVFEDTGVKRANSVARLTLPELVSVFLLHVCCLHPLAAALCRYSQSLLRLL